jgi:hypothetical protein
MNFFVWESSITSCSDTGNSSVFLPVFLAAVKCLLQSSSMSLLAFVISQLHPEKYTDSDCGIEQSFPGNQTFSLGLISTLLWPTDNQAAQVPAVPCAVLIWSRLLKLDKWCPSLGFSCSQIGWPTYPGVPGDFSGLALNTLNPRNCLVLGKQWWVMGGDACAEGPRIVILLVPCSRRPSCTSLTRYDLHFSFAPLSFCCYCVGNHVGKILHKLSYTKVLNQTNHLSHIIAKTCMVVSIPCRC